MQLNRDIVDSLSKTIKERGLERLTRGIRVLKVLFDEDYTDTCEVCGKVGSLDCEIVLQKEKLVWFSLGKYVIPEGQTEPNFNHLSFMWDILISPSIEPSVSVSRKWRHDQYVHKYINKLFIGFLLEKWRKTPSLLTLCSKSLLENDVHLENMPSHICTSVIKLELSY